MDPETIFHKKQLFKPVWQQKGHPHRNYSNKKVSPNSQLQMVNSQSIEQSDQEDEVSEAQYSLYFPIIQKKRYKILREKESDHQQNDNEAKNKLRQYFKRSRDNRHLRRDQILKNFRKIGHAVLFTIYLRTYNERMRLQRKTNFGKYLKISLKDRLLDLKQLLIDHSLPLFTAIIDQYNFDYRAHPKDDSKLRRQKIKHLRKLVNLQIDCLRNCIAKVCSKAETFMELLYYLCRHGSYSCLNSINTPEQLGIMCISQAHGYLRADKYLQQSALVSLIFVKMLLFNIFFDSEMLNLPSNPQLNKQTVLSNIALLGTILYELFIDIQDDLLEQAPPIYTVGNWQQLQHRYNFKPSPNMTVKPGFFQKNELISGLEDHKNVKDTYGTKMMTEQKQAITGLLTQLHQLLKRYHERVREKCFVK